MLYSLSRSDVIRALEKEFGFSGDEAALKLSAINEHVRAALLLESQQPAQRHIVPVSTATITRTVRRKLAPLWPELLDDTHTDEIALGELRHMRVLGEVAKVDALHWVPAPARTIWIDEATRLLISASPLPTLQLRTRKALQVVGRARLISVDEATSQMHPPLQRLEDWLGCPHDEIAIWAKAFMERVARKMQPVEQFDELDIFHNGRWRPSKDLPGQLGKVHLYRRKVHIYGNPTNEYGLCRLHARKDGESQVISSLIIERDHARRLRGSMTMASGQQQLIRYEKKGGVVVLELPRLLPAPESAVLSLGWLLAEQASNDWPKRIAFSVRLVPLLRRSFGLLGYRLAERANGGARDAE
ncbi:hypothetical protein [Achromobacter denitrificans]|uniref:hypothetical protein n=1 Tax=Achromobacter denitrificans TaxID=32002 RepID=UPI003CFD5B86